MFAMTEQQAALLVALLIDNPETHPAPAVEPRTWSTLQGRGLVDAARKLTELGEAAAIVAWRLVDRAPDPMQLHKECRACGPR